MKENRLPWGEGRLDHILVTHLMAEYHAARNALGLKEFSPAGLSASPSWGSGGGRTAWSRRKGQLLMAVNTGGGEWNTGYTLALLRGLLSEPPKRIWDSGSAALLNKTDDLGMVYGGSWVKRWGASPDWFWEGRAGQKLCLEARGWPSAGLYSGDFVLSGTDIFQGLKEKAAAEGALLFTFETWAVAEAARLWGCPVSSLRVATDHGDQKARQDFKKNLTPFLGNLYAGFADNFKEMS